MSAPMTMQELANLLNHIKAEHSFCGAKIGQQHVKYIDPVIDTRTWHCFAITFRVVGDGVTFHTQNECRDLPESLYERCMAWLDNPTKESHWEGSGLPKSFKSWFSQKDMAGLGTEQLCRDAWRAALSTQRFFNTIPNPKASADQRALFEQACYEHYIERHAAGVTTDSDAPACTIEQLMWRDDRGEYCVLMFNAAWWAWQKRGEQ